MADKLEAGLGYNFFVSPEYRCTCRVEKMASETAAKPCAEKNRQIIEVHIKEKMVSGNSGEASAAGGYSV